MGKVDASGRKMEIYTMASTKMESLTGGALSSIINLVRPILECSRIISMMMMKIIFSSKSFAQEEMFKLKTMMVILLPFLWEEIERKDRQLI